MTEVQKSGYPLYPLGAATGKGVREPAGAQKLLYVDPVLFNHGSTDM